MPLLPFINDNRENVEDIVRRAKDAGASYILPMFGVTLRKGSRDYFFKELDRSFPRMKEKYVSAYGDQYICNSPDIRNLDRFFTTLARELKIASQMRFYVPPKVNEQLSLF